MRIAAAKREAAPTAKEESQVAGESRVSRSGYGSGPAKPGLPWGDLFSSHLGVIAVHPIQLHI